MYRRLKKMSMRSSAVLIAMLCQSALGVEVSGDQSGRWTIFESPYIVIDDVIIPKDQTLTIEPGVVVKFVGYSSMVVQGTLQATGNSVDRIVFTSIHDNEFGLRGRPSTTLPTTKDWRGIEFSPTSKFTSRLDYCILRYSDEVVISRFAGPAITNTIIVDCESENLIIFGKKTEITNGLLSDYLPPQDESTPALQAPGPEAERDGLVADGNDAPSSQTENITGNNPTPESGRIFGVIKDRETGETLPGANISLLSAVSGKVLRGAAAGAQGEYEIRNVMPGDYQISVSYIGYQKTVSSVLSLAPGEVRNLALDLRHVGIEFNPIVITASRRPEKVFDAPAAITVLDEEQINHRSTLTVTDHLSSMPAVDYISSGINQSNIVVRGFNNVFSGALLSLTDNRIARVPSLRFNAYNLIPLSNADIERIEVVAGPGSAIYGPNSANGVMHIITKSPIGSEGTTVSAGGGERVDFVGSFRHAASTGSHFGYRLSGQYYTGRDWEFFDPAEPDSFVSAGQRIAAPERDFEVEKFGGELRLDFRPADDLNVIFSTGFAQVSDIELTGLGASQVQDWQSSYLQGRLYYKGFFAQTYMNRSNAGDSFLLRTGDPIIDKSVLLVGQLQHSFSLGGRQRFTYGTDFLRTRPATEGSINGRHEQQDVVNEIGAFVQSETSLSDFIDLHLAARVDDHNFIEERVFSPRAALMFKPSEDHTMRLTYNRAFSTPSSNNLFLDLLSLSVPTSSINASLAPIIGPTLMNVYAAGTAPRGMAFPIQSNRGGFHFNYDAQNRPLMVSAFGNALGVGNAYLPSEVNSVWPVLRQLVLASQTEQAVREALDAALPVQLEQRIPGLFRKLNPSTGAFDPIDRVQDIPQTEPTITTSFEFGYKGFWGNKLLMGVDVHHTQVKDFVGPLIVETPHVFIDSDSLFSVLSSALESNGFPRAFAEFTAGEITSNFATLPIGLVSPVEVQNPTDVILTYRNFGDISLSGVDLGMTYYASPRFSLSANYSYLSRNFFAKDDSQPHDIALNAPKHKFRTSLSYLAFDREPIAQATLRYVEGFPVNSGVYLGHIQTYTLVDLDFAFDVLSKTKLSISVKNLLDNRHREMIGAPELGRQAIARIIQSF